MGILGLSPEEERKEVIEEVIELYTNLNSGKPAEVAKSSSAFMREYEKVLDKLKNYFQKDLINDIPDFVNDLSEAIEFKEVWCGIATPEVKIKTIELGLKKIMRKFKVDIPEKQNPQNETPNLPFQINQIMNTEINISNENKIEISGLFNNVEQELKEEEPNYSKISGWISTIKGILKLVGFFGK